MLTQHPDLAGRLRVNLRSARSRSPTRRGATRIGARAVASDASLWLERDRGAEPRSRSAFEEALLRARVAPPYDPLAELAAARMGRRRRASTACSPATCASTSTPTQAVQLARLFMGDLVATLRNELVRQRVLIVGIATDLELDVAGALLGRHGSSTTAARCASARSPPSPGSRRALVQVGMTTISDQPGRALQPAADVRAVRPGRAPPDLEPGVPRASASAPPTRGTAAKIDERCIVLELRAAHALDALAADARQIIAEGVARAAELAATPVLGAQPRHDRRRARGARGRAHRARDHLRYRGQASRPRARRMGSGDGRSGRHIVRSHCLRDAGACGRA